MGGWTRPRPAGPIAVVSAMETRGDCSAVLSAGSDGPQGLEVGIQDGRISRCVPEGLDGGRQPAGSDRKRLCRRGPGRNLHVALLFLGAPASSGVNSGLLTR